MRKHIVNHRDQELLLSVLENEEWSDGSYCRLFEKQIAHYIGTKYAIIMPNCTYSFKLVLRCLGIKDGDEVIVPAITWPSMIVAIMECNAIPVIVDVGACFQMIADNLSKKISNKTKVILATHLYGFYENIEEIKKIIGNKKIYIVEDCAHVVGYKLNGRMLGSLGDVAVTSFNSKKILTCGEGGCIFTNNDEIYNSLREMRAVEERESKYGFLPSNYLVSEFQAAILISQLEKYNELLIIEYERAMYISKVLNKSNRISVYESLDKVEMQTFYNYVFAVDNKAREVIDGVNSKCGNVLSLIYPPLINSGVFGRIEEKYKNLLKNWDEKEISSAKNLYQHCCRFHHSLLLMRNDDLDRILETIIDIVGE